MLAWRVDGGLTGLASRRGLLGGRGLAADPQYARVIWSAPAVRSAATAHAPPAPARSRDYRTSTPASSRRTIKHQTKSGAATTGPGGHHNRRPTGGVLLYSKLIRCNDYPTLAAPTEPPREANRLPGFSGVPPEPTFGDFCLATKVTRARGRGTAALRKHAGGMFLA